MTEIKIMDITKLLNEEKPKNKKIIAEKYLEKVTRPKVGRRHLTWKEKRRERALRQKCLRKGLTNEEKLELDDLNFVEVITSTNLIIKEFMKKKPKQNGKRKDISEVQIEEK